MLLRRTEKARAELTPGVRTLGLRERSLLLLADGNKSIVDFRPLFGGEGEQIVLGLVRKGYLEPAGSAPAFRPESSGMFAISTTSFSAAQAPNASQLAADPAPEPMPAAIVPAPANASDGFEGKRSLATTRMFLFDICERMFARRDPVLAERFRQALRGAKDRQTMLAAGRDMIAEIERVAGHERADSISERIAMLLPSEMAA